jgi:hypothetical protein
MPDALTDASLVSRPRAPKSDLEIEDVLPPELHEELAAKGGKSLVVDDRWVYDRYQQVRALWRAVVKQEGKGGTKAVLVEVLRTAPGPGALGLLLNVLRKPETLKDVSGRLHKTEDEDELLKRERDGNRRYRVIGELLEAGGPVPPWQGELWRKVNGEAVGV